MGNSRYLPEVSVRYFMEKNILRIVPNLAEEALGILGSNWRLRMLQRLLSRDGAPGSDARDEDDGTRPSTRGSQRASTYAYSIFP